MLVPEETWQDQYIITNGIKLHFVTQGEGKLMLMLHGFPEFWYSWRHQIPEFAKDYIRELIHPPFQVIYLREDDAIKVIRIWRSERLLRLDDN